jgi:hypothetical protein
MKSVADIFAQITAYAAGTINVVNPPYCSIPRPPCGRQIPTGAA